MYFLQYIISFKIIKTMFYSPKNSQKRNGITSNRSNRLNEERLVYTTYSVCTPSQTPLSLPLPRLMKVCAACYQAMLVILQRKLSQSRLLRQLSCTSIIMLSLSIRYII